MALRFVDSWDHYTTLLQKWSAIDLGGGSDPIISAAAARTGAYGLRITMTQNVWRYIRLILDAQSTWIVGVAFRTSAQPPALTSIITEAEGALRLNNDGTLSLIRGIGITGTVLATSVRSLMANVFYYIEFKHIIDNVAGTLEVRVDGEVWATFAGDTQNTNPTASSIYIEGRAANNPGAYPIVHFDDLYILDGVDQSIADPNSPPNNDYWGNTQVECRVPNGVGNYAEWLTLVGAATHWQAVNEVPPNEDTSYVADAVLNSRDTYAFQDLSVVSATIPGIQVLMRARMTAAGAANIARLYRRAAVDNQGADVVLQTTYNYIREIMGGDPIGVANWTVAAINSGEFGARVR